MLSIWICGGESMDYCGEYMASGGDSTKCDGGLNNCVGELYRFSWYVLLWRYPVRMIVQSDLHVTPSQTCSLQYYIIAAVTAR